MLLTPTLAVMERKRRWTCETLANPFKGKAKQANANSKKVSTKSPAKAKVAKAKDENEGKEPQKKSTASNQSIDGGNDTSIDKKPKARDSVIVGGKRKKLDDEDSNEEEADEDNLPIFKLKEFLGEKKCLKSKARSKGEGKRQRRKRAHLVPKEARPAETGSLSSDEESSDDQQDILAVEALSKSLEYEVRASKEEGK